MKAAAIALLVAGCGETVLFAPLEPGRPAGLLIIDRDPSRGVRALSPIPERVLLDDLGGGELDLIAYDASFAVLGLGLDGSFLELAADGVPLPVPDHWLHRSPNEDTFAKAAPAELAATFPDLRVAPPPCAALTPVHEHVLEGIVEVSALAAIDPTSAIIATKTSTGVTRLFVSDITAIRPFADLEEGRPGAGVGITAHPDGGAYVASSFGGVLTLDRRSQGAIRVETDRYPWPHAPIRGLAAQRIEGRMRLVWSTTTSWGTIDRDQGITVELGQSRIDGCSDGLGGALELFADGTGVVGFTGGTLSSFDLAAQTSEVLIADNARPCRASYARDPETGREIVLTDGDFGALWWRESRGELWRTTGAPTLTARAVRFGPEGSVIASGSGDVSVSVVPDFDIERPPTACDIEPHGTKVTELLTMGEYVVVVGQPDRDARLRVQWLRVEER